MTQIVTVYLQPSSCGVDGSRMRTSSGCGSWWRGSASCCASAVVTGDVLPVPLKNASITLEWWLKDLKIKRGVVSGATSTQSDRRCGSAARNGSWCSGSTWRALCSSTSPATILNQGKGFSRMRIAGCKDNIRRKRKRRGGGGGGGGGGKRICCTGPGSDRAHKSPGRHWMVVERPLKGLPSTTSTWTRRALGEP